jgi:hypothetical protein
MANIERNIYEGWTPRAFIEDLGWQLALIMNGQSWKKPFTTRAQIKEWCMDNQPYYKGYVEEVVDYFCKKWHIK